MNISNKLWINYGTFLFGYSKKQDKIPQDLSCKLTSSSNDINEGQIINQLLGNRLYDLQQILREINSEITERLDLSHKLSRNIDSESCMIKNKLLSIERYPIGLNRIIDNRRDHIEKLLDDMEKEKRQRVTEGWKDIALLRKELRSTLKEYKNILRKLDIVTGNIGVNCDGK